MFALKWRALNTDVRLACIAGGIVVPIWYFPNVHAALVPKNYSTHPLIPPAMEANVHLTGRASCGCGQFKSFPLVERVNNIILFCNLCLQVMVKLVVMLKEQVMISTMLPSAAYCPCCNVRIKNHIHP